MGNRPDEEILLSVYQKLDVDGTLRESLTHEEMEVLFKAGKFIGKVRNTMLLCNKKDCPNNVNDTCNRSFVILDKRGDCSSAKQKSIKG